MQQFYVKEKVSNDFQEIKHELHCQNYTGTVRGCNFNQSIKNKRKKKEA